MKVIKKLEEEKAIVSYYDSYIPKFINNGKEYKFLKNLTGKILNSYFRRRERIINFFDSFVNYAGQMAWIGIIEKYFVY